MLARPCLIRKSLGLACTKQSHLIGQRCRCLLCINIKPHKISAKVANDPLSSLGIHFEGLKSTMTLYCPFPHHFWSATFHCTSKGCHGKKVGKRLWEMHPPIVNFERRKCVFSPTWIYPKGQPISIYQTKPFYGPETSTFPLHKHRNHAKSPLVSDAKALPPSQLYLTIQIHF